jgi:hypothetical protein
LQHLLGRAKWDAEELREDLRSYVVDHLGDDDAVLVVDETGDVKKGTCTVGVQREYTGTAGRIENSQVAVYLAYAGPEGRALVEGRCICRGAGLTTPAGARSPRCPTTSSSPPKPRRRPRSDGTRS